MASRSDRPTFVDRLVKCLGTQRFNGNLLFDYDNGLYVVNYIDGTGMSYGDKNWNLSARDSRFTIANVVFKRRLLGSKCIVHMRDWPDGYS